MNLAVYSNKSTDELIASYELSATDLANSHRDLSDRLSQLHSHYLEIFFGSIGKTVAERNREADYNTRGEYAEIITLRGQINYMTSIQNMLANIINWRIHSIPPNLSQLEYPLDRDKEAIGNG